MISCVLCYDAPCSKACGKIDPAGLLRSIWFDNEKTAAAEMPAVNPCAGCSAPCEHVCVKPGQVEVKNLLTRLYEEVRPELEVPMPGDEDVPPDENLPAPEKKPSGSTQAPPGFWTDLMTASRKELKPPASGFFVAAQNSPLRGALKGDKLELRCQNTFVADTVNRPVILEVVTRKASALLGRPVSVVVVDMSAKPAGNPHMEKLLNFGKAHSDVIKIKE